MKNVLSKIDTAVKIIFGYMGVAMILIESYAVFARNVLKTTSAWTDETLKFMFIWVIFICAALAFLTDDLIGLNLVEERLSGNKKAYGCIKGVQYVLALIFGFFTTTQGWNIISTQLTTGESTTVMKYPLWFINTGFLIGSIITVVFAIVKIVSCRKYFMKTSTVETE